MIFENLLLMLYLDTDLINKVGVITINEMLANRECTLSLTYLNLLSVNQQLLTAQAAAHSAGLY